MLKKSDTFTVEEMSGFDGYSWKGINCQTEEGIKHLYGIGAYLWIWESINIDYIAREIEDFLYDYDTYEYWDNYNDREIVVAEIKAQLKDFRVLKQILIHLYTDELVGEALYQALRKELKI